MSFTDTWRNAKVNDGESNTMPPDEGDYEVVLTNAKAFTAKSGSEIAVLELRVLIPETSAGYEWTEFLRFDSQMSANFAKTACFRLGVDVENIGTFDELNTALQAQVGGYYAVKVVRKGEYLNTYIDEQLTPAQTPEAAAPATTEPVMDDDGVPF